MTKPLWQSKTFWVNLISATIAILEGQQITNIIPADWQAEVIALVFALNIALRYITTQPVSLTGSGGGQ